MRTWGWLLLQVAKITKVCIWDLRRAAGGNGPGAEGDFLLDRL